MIYVFLIMCQIQAGELVHCTPPHAIAGHMYSQVQWPSEWPTWDACMAEAERRNTPRQVVEGRQGWRFFCYATNKQESRDEQDLRRFKLEERRAANGSEGATRVRSPGL